MRYGISALGSMPMEMAGVIAGCAGPDLVAIQQNLGHADVKTTLAYIGELDAEKRKPPVIDTFDLERLNGTPVQEWKRS